MRSRRSRAETAASAVVVRSSKAVLTQRTQRAQSGKRKKESGRNAERARPLPFNRLPVFLLPFVCALCVLCGEGDQELRLPGALLSCGPQRRFKHRGHREHRAEIQRKKERGRNAKRAWPLPSFPLPFLCALCVLCVSIAFE